MVTAPLDVECRQIDFRAARIGDHQIAQAVDDFGIERYANTDSLKVNSAEESLAIMRQALSYENKAAGDIVALNAGAAIYAANLVDSLAAGVNRAQEILESGAALAKLEELINFSAAAGE